MGINGSIGSTPDWSPNGDEIAYATDLGGNQAIVVINSTGSHARAISASPAHLSSPSWSPSGLQIAYAIGSRGKGATRRPGWLMIARSDGTRQRSLVRDGSQPDWRPQ
jgi:TolB protein